MATRLAQDKFSLKDTLLSCSLVIVGIITRIIPHAPNFTPEIVFALYLGIQYTRLRALLFILLMAIISDVIIGWNSNYPVFGLWTFFTYSALMVTGLCGVINILQRSKTAFLCAGLLSTIVFWLWTNLGVWLFAGMYAHTVSGFLQCYILALPFLNTALMGSLLWAIIIIAYEYILTWFKIRHCAILQAN